VLNNNVQDLAIRAGLVEHNQQNPDHQAHEDIMHEDDQQFEEDNQPQFVDSNQPQLVNMGEQFVDDLVDDGQFGDGDNDIDGDEWIDHGSPTTLARQVAEAREASQHLDLGFGNPQPRNPVLQAPGTDGQTLQRQLQDTEMAGRTGSVTQGFDSLSLNGNHENHTIHSSHIYQTASTSNNITKS
jgi:hypothetical protein